MPSPTWVTSIKTKAQAHWKKRLHASKDMQPSAKVVPTTDLDIAAETRLSEPAAGKLAPNENPELEGLCAVCRAIDLEVDSFIIPQQDHDWEGLREMALSEEEEDGWSKWRALQNSGIEWNIVDRGSGDVENPRTNPFGGSKDKTLGTFGEICRKTGCPFCRLVVAALRSGPATELEAKISTVDQGILDKEPIIMSWKESYDPKFAGSEFIKEDVFDLRERRYLNVRNRSETRSGNLTLLGANTPSPWTFGKLVTETQINPQEMRTWLGACEGWHGDTCSASISARRESFPLRVIDVQENYLVDGSKINSPELCLGAVSSISDYQSNLSGLEKLGGLLQYRNEIPVTIQDAITLVRQLGERYLWVDQLCIVQDDEENKSIAINNMDLIYDGAILTIIAGVGNSAQAGLPGVRSGSRAPEQQIEEVKPNMRLMVFGNGPAALRASAYNTRGWTYQERLLSRRVLAFVNNQVYFQCRTTSWSEEVIAIDSEGPERPPAKLGESAALANDTKAPRSVFGWLNKFQQVASRYGSRRLTDPSDIMRAFKALSNVLGDGMNTPMFWGLPTFVFDSAILWQPAKEPLQRRTGFLVGLGQWSINKWLSESTWIIWYGRDENGKAKLLWQQSDSPHPYVEEEHTAWGRCFHGYGIEGQDPYGREESPKSNGRYNIFEGRGETVPSRAALSIGSVELRSQYLYFWTVSTRFIVQRRKDPTSRYLSLHSLLDQEPVIGSLILDEDWDNAKLKGANENGVHRFLVLSEASGMSEDDEFFKQVKELVLSPELFTSTTLC